MADSIDGSWMKEMAHKLRFGPTGQPHKKPVKICIPCEGCNIQHDFLIGEMPRLCKDCWDNWIEASEVYGCTYKEWLAQKTGRGMYI
jgi:hypothetical protein